MTRPAIYFDGTTSVRCTIVRRGRINTRIILDDKSDMLVDSNSVTIGISSSSDQAPQRLVPIIPLEVFYRSLRKMTGSKKSKFDELRSLLSIGAAPREADFLCELFRRSVRHAEDYSNRDESFYSSRVPREKENYGFANNLVKAVFDRKSLKINGEPSNLSFVDYEISPFRTTSSRNETGLPASCGGSGRIDLLMASDSEGVLPAICEIKAATETVGPTFALIQALMCASQIATRNQFLRLKRHYEKLFKDLDEATPRVDVCILLEKEGPEIDSEDLRYAINLSQQIHATASSRVRRITFLSCSLRGNEIWCDIIKPS